MNKRSMLKGIITIATAVAGLAAASSFAAEVSGPVLAVISHPVKDYAAWRQVYESAEPIRQKAGVTAAEVFRDPANPNTMVIIHRFKTVAAAKAFLADPDLKAAMTKGGVLAAPTSIIAVKEEN